MDHKKWGEVVLMPLVVALLGSGATYFITKTQIGSSERLAAAERDAAEKRARLERQLKVLEIFEAKITSPNSREAQMAIQLLEMADPEIAVQLADIVISDEGMDPKVRETARAVEAKARAGNAFPVVASTKDLDGAVDFARRIRDMVPEYPRQIYRTENADFYAVTLGGYLPLEEALHRVKIARDRGVAPDAFVWQSNKWGDNLYK